MKKFLLRRMGVANHGGAPRPSLADCIDIVVSQADTLINDVIGGLTEAAVRSAAGQKLALAQRQGPGRQDMTMPAKMAISGLNANAPAVRRTFSSALRAAVLDRAGSDGAEPTMVRFADVQLFDTREIDESIEFALAQQEVSRTVDDVLPPFSALISGLFGWITVQPTLNPLKPEAFVRALHRTLVAHIPDEAVRAALLTPAAGLLGVSLSQLYREAADWMRAQGVEPSASIGGPAGTSVATRAKPADTAASRTLLTLDRLRRLLSGELQSGVVDAGMKDFMHTVPASFVALQDLKLIEPMMKRLAERAASPQVPSAEKATTHATSKGKSLRGTNKDSAQTRQLGQKLGKEVVRMMLDSLMQDQRLLPKVRRQLRLVEPVLVRLSGADPRFFTDRQHPARRYLDRVTDRSLAFVAETDEGFPRFLKSITDAGTTLGKSSADATAFSTVLQALDDGWARDEKQQRERQEEVARMLMHAERRNVLAERYAKEFSERFRDSALPGFMTEFLFGPWSQVVAESQLSHHDGTVDPHGYLALVDDLSWSAQLVLTRRNPARLAQVVPQLLGQLRQGLKLIDFPEDRISDFFDVLVNLHETAFEVHRAAVSRKRGEAMGMPQDDEVAASTPQEETDPSEDAMESESPLFPDLPDSAAFWVADDASGLVGLGHALTATAMDFSAKSTTDELLNRGHWSPADLMVGAWVELLLNEQWVRAQLTWCSPHRTLFMFISGAGLAHSMSRRTMERLGTQNRIRLISSGGVIDNALDAVAQAALQNELAEVHQAKTPQKH